MTERNAPNWPLQRVAFAFVSFDVFDFHVCNLQTSRLMFLFDEVNAVNYSTKATKATSENETGIVSYIYIINYHNDLIIKYKKCTSSSLKNRCCFCCICGKCEKSTPFHAKKNCRLGTKSRTPENPSNLPQNRFKCLRRTYLKTCALRCLKTSR